LLPPHSLTRGFGLKFVEHQPSLDSKQKNISRKNGASFASRKSRQTADVRAVYP
jgi:hypothetical protein